MQIVRTLFFVSMLGLVLGGCTVIRGTANEPSGDVWYVRAGFYTAKVKGIYYCPSGGKQCREARIVSKEQYQRLTQNRVSGGEGSSVQPATQ
jgi:hypothetical protein